MKASPGPAEAACPLTVIGGFLGAGKTTFLNRLISASRGRRAVLVNDFGAVNVDARLIVDHDGKTMRLSNGCVCCSLSDGFLDVLVRVLGEDPPFDAVVVEASGVGDPWAIAEIASVEPALVLAGVVVLADAARIAALLRDDRVGDVVAGQIRAADIVLLNKLDLVDEAGRQEAWDALRGIRPDLRVVETTRAELPDDMIGLGGTARDGAECRRSEGVMHEERFRRVTYRRSGRFDPARLPRALATLPVSLLRLKGMCLVAGRPGVQILQMVGSRWSLADAPAGPGDWPIELVGIGTDVGLDGVAAILDNALMPEAAPGTARCAGDDREENAACL